MRVLITGGEGQVGWELRHLLSAGAEVVSPPRADLDLVNPDQLLAVVRDVRPDLIINAAAYTAVDRAETEVDAAMAVNGRAPGILAEEARRRHIPFIHFSTDYVFDGQASVPYREEDVPHPLNVYGHSKLAGETAVREVDGIYLILRTSWVYGLRGRNFLRTVLRLAAEPRPLRIVDDQIGAPTWCRELARAVQCVLADASYPDKKGLYHLTNAGQTSWHGFATEILAHTHAADPAAVVAIPSADYPTPAARPRWSVLSNARFNTTFGCGLPDWQESLAACLVASA